MTGLTSIEWIKLAIYFASYAYFFAVPVLFWAIWKDRIAPRWLSLGSLIIISLLAYGRFVEPRILRAPEHAVQLDKCFEEEGAARVALFSDTHIGLFANVMPIDRISARINAAEPDVVLIAGDFVYFLDPERYESSFAALAKIKAPVYAVLGNHDLGLPGPDFSTDLNKALPVLNVHLIDDKPRDFRLPSGEMEFVGLSDDWAGEQALDLLERRGEVPRVVLTHNPASVLNFSEAMRADLLLGGHTHGGQINLPFITCWVTNMCGPRRYGLSRAVESYPHRIRPIEHTEQILPAANEDIQIFTTSGTGMVGLPMRFRTPPRIDLLNLTWRACE